jgi:hypothetical protein
MDEDRRKWTRYLYGVDWEDPSLYDLVINLEHISIDQACHLVIGMTKEAAFDLALNPFTANLEVEVHAASGSIRARNRAIRAIGCHCIADKRLLIS